ncbi:hypothetical protein QLX08_005874 [Tetragonisca angustula]|uniref:Uncharacterized protein n=1 Tax=Tetragonisca angustula TaxID=166442 RepID=A0AAW0ZWW9_9HYME
MYKRETPSNWPKLVACFIGRFVRGFQRSPRIRKNKPANRGIPIEAANTQRREETKYPWVGGSVRGADLFVSCPSSDPRDGSGTRQPRSCRELSRSSRRACDACCCIVAEEEEEHRSSIFVPRDGAGRSSRPLRARARLARKSRERKQEGSGGADRNTIAIERSRDGMSLVLRWLERRKIPDIGGDSRRNDSS